MPAFGHTEPKRGAKWWGKALLVTFGAFPKVTRRKGGTASRRYKKNGYTHQPTPLGYRELTAYGAYGITRLCSVLR
ncbi:hypothetical protein CEQ51_17280 [Pseudomonas thivervalensis]|uniref:Uncharacterized protein n=1 Tax=Pseudomonas thivervalensis TaxID=86265 RepID=A0A2Z4ZTK8_9PSED|nr:hypothetical protein CE140_16725 [Pseudomonas thivervalensis]AXA61755.1 hypothetical protein CEQ51_17280 [Pseudomonas thivervalensis]